MIKQKIDMSFKLDTCDKCKDHPIYPCIWHVVFLDKDNKPIPRILINPRRTNPAYSSRKYTYKKNRSREIFNIKNKASTPHIEKSKFSKYQELKQMIASAMWSCTSTQHDFFTFHNALNKKIENVFDDIKPYYADYSMILRRIKILEGNMNSMNNCKGCNCTKE